MPIQSSRFAAHDAVRRVLYGLYWASLGLLGSVWLALGWITPVWALEPAHTMASKREGAAHGSAAPQAIAGRPSGAWHGTWEVTRDHPGIRTRAGALALRLQIDHARHGASPQVRWVADRAMCASPDAAPCEWVGNKGVAVSTRVVAGHLLAVLQVSADDTDPFVVWLERPDSQGRSAQGSLMSARGDLNYPLQAHRP